MYNSFYQKYLRLKIQKNHVYHHLKILILERPMRWKKIKKMFYLISWISWTIHVLFAILCIAAGLYYIAETIEEYTIYSKQVMQWMILAVLVILRPVLKKKK